MADFIISSYFENNTGPITGLSPTIRIWEISATGNTLLVGAPCGVAQSTDGAMVEVSACGSPATTQDGFYSFNFSAALGYDPTKFYVIRVDGGSSLASQFRYQSAELTPAQAISNEGVWDVQRASHLLSGSTGEALSQIKADTTNISDKLYLDADSVLDVVQLMLKMDAGRTKIDPAAKTLTIYDTDCTTVLRTFELYDSNGNKSITDVCERIPRVKGPGDGTTIDYVCSSAIP